MKLSGVMLGSENPKALIKAAGAEVIANRISPIKTRTLALG